MTAVNRGGARADGADPLPGDAVCIALSSLPDRAVPPPGDHSVDVGGSRLRLGPQLLEIDRRVPALVEKQAAVHRTCVTAGA